MRAYFLGGRNYESGECWFQFFKKYSEEVLCNSFPRVAAGLHLPEGRNNGIMKWVFGGHACACSSEGTNSGMQE